MTKVHATPHLPNIKRHATMGVGTIKTVLVLKTKLAVK